MATPIENNTEGLLQILQKVNALPDAGGGGVTVQSTTGTFTTDGQGNATVNLGFKPDVVRFMCEGVYGKYSLESGVDFNISGTTSALVICYKLQDNWYVEFPVTRTDNGFVVEYACGYDISHTETFLQNETYTYSAVKYT